MLLDDGLSKFKTKLGISELDSLLSSSILFPGTGHCESFRSKEASDVLKANCTLYKIAEAQGDYKLKVPELPRKRHRSTTKQTDAGSDWFHLKTPELTPEVKEDLSAILLRRHLDPKRFYKKSDMKEVPNHFQIGTILNSTDEPRSNRIEKAKKNKSLVEQLLDDDENLKFSKKKWEQVMKIKPKRLRNSKGSKPQKKRKLGFR